MKTKQRMRFEIKEITPQGSFEGILSPYNNVDGGDDVVDPGAYTKTLEKGLTRPLLWQHKSDMPIGQLTLEDRPDGLWCKGQLLLEDSMAQKAYLFIKAGIVKGLSIGFESVKDTVENGIRHLKEIKLYEGSIVTFPMNEMALITSVKGKESKDDFNEELSDIQLMDMGRQMFNALCCSLGSITWDDTMDRGQKISAASTYIQQFSDAYMAYMPMFLDMLAEDYGGMEMMAAKHVLEMKAGKPTKRVDGVDLTADCFAYVGDPEKTETWKLPIKFPGDEDKTKSHIRNALARFSQTQGIPASERDKVLAKIHAAAKKYGIDVADKSGEELEEKAGRMISQANMDKLSQARDHMKAAHDIVSTLVDYEAGDNSTPKGAAEPTTLESQAVDTKSEPVIDHSALSQILTKVKEFNGTRNQTTY